jgi:tetratricopeptide (TPR) repeat protein
VELLLELGAGRDRGELQGERHHLLARKLEILSLHDPGSSDARAAAVARWRGRLGTGPLVPAAARSRGADPDADALETTSPQASDPLGWSALLLLQMRRDLAARSGDLGRLAEIYGQLSQASGVPPMARVYRLRAAQLLAARGDAPDVVEALLARNFEENPADPHSARALEEHRLRSGRLGELCRQYEEHAAAYPELRGLLLRKAAMVAEAHRRDRSLASSLRREGLAHLPDPSGQGDLQRHYRALGSDPRLVDAYAREADTTDDPGLAALLWSEVAVLHLKRDQLGAAETAARDALRAQPGDPLALTVLALVYRVEGRSGDLCAVLEQQWGELRSVENRVAALRELALLSAEPRRAYELLLAARELQPEDPVLLSELLAASELLGQLEDAVRWGGELRRALGPDHAAAAQALLRVGQLRSKGLGDLVGAAEALEEALVLDPHLIEAARELVRVRRSAADPAALLVALDTLLPLEPDPGARGLLLLEAGRTLEALGRSEEAGGRYAEAAQLEAVRDEALAELERVCRQAGRLEELARVMAELPESVAVLERLARVLEQSGDRDSLCDVLARLQELSTSPLERADRGYELGRLLEQLGRTGEATGQYEQVLVEVPGHQPALRALQRIFRADQRGDALVRVLEQELQVAGEPSRRAEILLELSRVLEEQGRPDASAAFLEEAVSLQPDNLEALWALQRLYEAGHPLALARVLRLRAGVSTERSEKAALSLRAALLLLEQEADEETAGELLREAFHTDPGNREAFTSYESFLYQRGRHNELMGLYDRALRYVEEEGGRAYRPLDLYSRKGQLLLNHLGQPGEAAASYLKALEHDPKSEAAMKMLEAIFLQQQDWLGLVRAYEHRANLVPHNELFRLESLRQAARLAVSRLPALPEEGERLWEEVYRLDPIDEEALDNLERIYEKGDKEAKLVDLLEHRAALLPSEEARLALHFRVAELAEQKLEDPDRAAAAYENVRRFQEHNEQALKALARIYEATGRWSRCLAMRRDLGIIEADPDERSLLYFKCGSILESRFGDDDEAIKCYELAIKEAPGCLPALHGLRDLHLRREDWNRALDTLELEYRVWDEERERAGILARMGEIRLQHLRDLRKAAEHFQDALAVDPDCYPAAQALFDIAFERGDSARALSLSESLAQRMAREGDPETRSKFYCRRGQLLAGTGRLQAAAESLVVALELRPKNLEALDWLIALCRRSPESYDFATIFRELEQVYRREGDQAAVGHVLVAGGARAEIAGDAETALERYHEAVEAAPADLAPARSLADLRVPLRRPEAGAAELRRLVDRVREPGLKRKALFRLAELYSLACGSPERAAATYAELLALDPADHEAADRLAGEQVLLGRPEEAYRTVSALLDRVTSEAGARPRELAGYTQHLGVILLRLGDPDGAVEQFRRALQLDETNAEAAMALARQLVLGGDRDGAERLLRGTLALLGEPPGLAGLELRRSLAGLYLGGGRVEEAVACYEAAVREGDRLDDRLALAEIYARQPQGIPRAMAELQRIVDGNSLDLQVLHLLAELCEDGGAPDRAMQVLKVLEMLGGATEEDRRKLQALRRGHPFRLTGGLEPPLRRMLEPPAGDRHVQDLWRAIAEPLDALFPPELPGQKITPAAQTGEELLCQLADRCGDLVGIRPLVLVADDVPGGVLASSEDGGAVVLDRVLLARTPPELAFVLARSLRYLHSGHALVSRLAFDDRLLLCELLGGLLSSSEEGSVDLVHEFRRGVSRKALRQIDEVAASYAQHLSEGGEPEIPARWLAGVDLSANKYGLLASDEIGAALRMVARLGGQELAIGPAGEVAVQLVTDGPALVRFYLSPDYVSLRRALLH